jgi:hypothetical protein
MVGENWEEMCHCICVSGSKVTLEHDTPLHHCIRVGKSICLSFDHPQVHMLGPPLSQCCQDNCHVIHMFKRSPT